MQQSLMQLLSVFTGVPDLVLGIPVMLIHLLTTLIQSFFSSWLIYLVMVVFAVWGYRIIRDLRGYRDAFAQVETQLGDNTTAENLRNWFCGRTAQEQLFKNQTLQGTLTEYAQACQKNGRTEGAAGFVDLTVFFNRDYLDEIGNTGLADLIPGTMTALGILGTFIGLVQGVSGFDTSTAEAISSSVTTLLAGMETAFWTSIIGVILSLGFSHFHKRVYEAANEKMELFAAAFHSCGLDGSENTPENQLLRYQKQQTELMQNMAGVISESISNSMKTELLPVFTRMEQSVELFGKLASQQQKEGLEQVVQEFIRRMNESLGGQFEGLAATLQSVSDWQKQSAQQMQNIVDNLCSTSGEIQRVHDISRQTVEEMKGFVELLKQYQEKLHEEAGLIQNRIQAEGDITQRQARYIEELAGCEQRIAAMADQVKQAGDAVQQTVDQMADHCQEQVTLVAQSARAQLEELSQAANQQASGLSELSDRVAAGMQQAGDRMTDGMKRIAGSMTSEMKQAAAGMTESMQQASANVTAEMKQASAGMERAAKVLDQDLDQALDRTFTSFDKNLTDIAQHLSGTIADVRDATEALPHVIRESQKQYQTVLKELTDETRNYTAAMAQLTQRVQREMPAEAPEEGSPA